MNDKIISPCSFAMHYSNTVLLHRQFGSIQGAASSVPVLNENYEYLIDEYRSYVTLFVSNALLKYFVPSLLILFRLRSSIVSVYHEWGWWTCNQWVDKFSHCVRLQCITQVLCCFVADIVWRKIQVSDCLYWMKMCEYVMND